MPAWAWALIAVGVVVGVRLAVLGVWKRRRATRTEKLQGRFGPEYQRTLKQRGAPGICRLLANPTCEAVDVGP
jgi:hypothetical protein